MGEPKLVRDLMHRGVITCKPETSLLEVVRVIADTDVHAIVVVDAKGVAKGIISHMDILPLYGEDLSNYQAKDIMTASVIEVSPETPVTEAARIMLDHKIHRLVVTKPSREGRKPIGVLSTTDIIRDMRGPKWVWYMG